MEQCCPDQRDNSQGEDHWCLLLCARKSIETHEIVALETSNDVGWDRDGTSPLCLLGFHPCRLFRYIPRMRRIGRSENQDSTRMPLVHREASFRKDAITPGVLALALLHSQRPILGAHWDGVAQYSALNQNRCLIIPGSSDVYRSLDGGYS